MVWNVPHQFYDDDHNETIKIVLALFTAYDIAHLSKLVLSIWSMHKLFWRNSYGNFTRCSH